jgi:hypothetical protein
VGLWDAGKRVGRLGRREPDSVDKEKNDAHVCPFVPTGLVDCSAESLRCSIEGLLPKYLTYHGAPSIIIRYENHGGMASGVCGRLFCVVSSIRALLLGRGWYAC